VKTRIALLHINHIFQANTGIALFYQYHQEDIFMANKLTIEKFEETLRG